MEKSCKNIEDMLVDYADGRLSPSDSSEVAAHLADCKHCRALLGGLKKSLALAGVIWTDSLSETESTTVSIRSKAGGFRWPQYAAVAASVLLAVTVSAVWLALTGPRKTETTVAEIEREILKSANAARLLAATELLADYPDAQQIAEQQYRYITETYAGTSAANEAKLKMQ